jgi:uncharacterized MnhB-related membrane protein
MRQQKDKIAQSTLNVIALLMVLGGIYLIFSQQDPLVGGVNAIIGSSLFSAERQRRDG